MADITLTGDDGSTIVLAPVEVPDIVLESVETPDIIIDGVLGGPPGEDGTDGVGISSVIRTSGTGAAGTTDTYTITYTDSTTSTFGVYNGSDGTNGTNGTNGTDGSTWYSGAGTPSTTHNDGDFYLNTSNGDVYKQVSGTWGSPIENLTGPAGTGSGDMLAATYDPNSVAGDAFDMDNMAQGTTNKYVTAAELTVLGNTSGTNTGDQTSVTGNAGTATKLATARAINGVNFDGSAAANIPLVKWSTVTGTSQTAAINSGYFANNSSLVTITLPTTYAVGSTVAVAYQGTGGWKIAQPSGDNIKFGNKTTTTGTSGYLASTDAGDTIILVGLVANTTWLVISSVGNITVV